MYLQKKKLAIAAASSGSTNIFASCLSKPFCKTVNGLQAAPYARWRLNVSN